MLFGFSHHAPFLNNGFKTSSQGALFLVRPEQKGLGEPLAPLLTLFKPNSAYPLLRDEFELKFSNSGEPEL